MLAKKKGKKKVNEKFKKSKLGLRLREGEKPSLDSTCS